MPVANHNENRIMAMLFSDIKDYSKIKDERLLTSIDSHLKGFVGQLSLESYIYCKSTGDGLFICGNLPSDVAEMALNLRDSFRNTDWIRRGFQTQLAVRIGLHAEKVKLLYENNKVENVIGQHVSAAARIEPIVDPNEVFCSSMFQTLLSSDQPSTIKTIPLGKKELAKNFGPMELYKLVRSHELADQTGMSSGTARPAIPMPTIKRNYTDKDLSDFLSHSFKVIVDYFEQGLKQLKQQSNDISTDFNPDGSTKLRCVIYVQGQRRAQCFIRLVEEYRSRTIRFSESQNLNEDSYNDLISVEHNDQTMYLRSVGALFAQTDSPAEKTPEQAATYLWSRFVRPLSR